MGGGNALTFEEFYNAARTALGLAVQTANDTVEDEEIAQFQAMELAEAKRGVSLDEEAIDIIMFQRAFQASTRIITVTDELLQTIINMV